MESLKGHLLVASTYLPDPNFAKTIVLIVEHDENGALGIVLNRPSKHQLKDVWENVTDETCHSRQLLRLGGPMGGPLMAIHTEELLADKPVIPGVYFSTEKENLLKLVKLDDEPYRFFSGYAGWGEGQLDGEVTSGDWLTMPATSDFLFSDGGDPWSEMLRAIFDDRLISALKIRHVPADPSLN